MMKQASFIIRKPQKGNNSSKINSYEIGKHEGNVSREVSSFEAYHNDDVEDNDIVNVSNYNHNFLHNYPHFERNLFILIFIPSVVIYFSQFVSEILIQYIVSYAYEIIYYFLFYLKTNAKNFHYFYCQKCLEVSFNNKYYFALFFQEQTKTFDKQI